MGHFTFLSTFKNVGIKNVNYIGDLHDISVGSCRFRLFSLLLHKEHFPLEMNKANHCSHFGENMNMLVNNVTLF